MQIALGQRWEMYSARRWVPVVVTKIEDDRVRLRYEGLIEFVTVKLVDMETKPELFRRARTSP